MTSFAGTWMPICGKWASAISRCRNGCRRFAEAFYGRQAAYLEALAAADRQAFENALSRNIFTGDVEDGAARLTRYACAAMSETGRPGRTTLCSAARSFFQGRMPLPERTWKCLNARQTNTLPRPGMCRLRSRRCRWRPAGTSRLSADAEARSAIAAVAGLRELPRLDASFEVTRQGADGCTWSAGFPRRSARTACVTLEPLANEVEEDIDLLFAPPAPSSEHKPVDDDNSEKPAGRVRHNLDGPEPLIGGIVDLGALGNRVPDSRARSLSAQAGRGFRAATRG